MKKLVLAIGLVIASAVNVFGQYRYDATVLPDTKYNLNYLEMNVRVSIVTNNMKKFCQDSLYINKLNKSYNKFVELDGGQHDIVPDTTKNLGSMSEYLKQLQPATGLLDLQEKYEICELAGFENQIMQIFHYDDVNDPEIEYIDIFEVNSIKNKVCIAISFIKYKNGTIVELGMSETIEDDNL